MRKVWHFFFSVELRIKYLKFAKNHDIIYLQVFFRRLIMHVRDKPKVCIILLLQMNECMFSNKLYYFPKVQDMKQVWIMQSAGKLKTG